MSDRETVTFDSVQFEALKTLLADLNKRLGPGTESMSLHQVITHLERTLFDGFQALTGNVNGGSDGSALNNKLDFLIKEIAQLRIQQDLILAAVEGEDQRKIDELTEALKPEADALEGSATQAEGE